MPEEKLEPVDWIQVDRVVSKKTNKTPAEIDELTLAEIAFYLEDWDEPRAGPGATACASSDEAFAFAHQWNRLTPMQKLERLRRERDNG